MILPVSLTAAAAAAFINLWLGIRIGQVRTSEKVSVGDGGNEKVIRRMRAQANFVEYTPFVLILFALIELAIGPQTWLWVLALVYIVARISHAFGMDASIPSKLRMAGIALTYLTMIALSIAALYAAYGSMREIEVPPALAAHV